MGPSRRRVIIVGGGFSGAMLAARLAEEGVASAVVDRSGTFGPGLAYSTPVQAHRLNVRTSRMGALASDPEGFQRWLSVRHPEHADPDGFAPRALFGRYLQDRFARVETSYPGRIERVDGEAIALEDGVLVLKDRRRLKGDAVVIASGNPPPRRSLADPRSRRRIPDPWAPGALARIGLHDRVILLGSGLTMIDVLLALEARGWRGSATAVSRRGLLPRAHGAIHDPPLPPPPDLLQGSASQRLKTARALTKTHGWRAIMEGLRPVTAEIWREADPAVRARWLRHLRPWWDVHRHRIPEDLAARFEDLSACGRLRVLAGRIAQADATAEGVRLRFQPRGLRSEVSESADWLVDCTGPDHDPEADGLTASLLAAGRARLDPLRLGLDADADGRVRDAKGEPAFDLFVLGPPARAALWETVAVPDIRMQIERLTERLRLGG